MRHLTILAALCVWFAVLADLSVLADPESNLAPIMKDGEIIKAKY